MISSVGLGILFSARDEATDVSNKLKEALHGLHEQAEKTHEGVFMALAKSGGIIATATAAVGAIGAGAAFEFAEHAERFSGAMTKAGVAAHATVEQMEGLEQFAKNTFLDSLNGSAITVAQSLQQLALEGYNVNEAAQAVTGAMTLMKISMGALDERASAGLVHDTLSQFGMDAGESSTLVDKLAFSMQHFGFRAEELQGTMSGLAAGAHLTGSSLDDVLVGVGLVHQVFPSATKSAMSMNVAMQQLADTHHQQLIAATLGIDVTDKQTKKLRPLVDVMRDLSVKTAHMSEAQLSHTLETIAGGRAAGGLSAIIDGLRKGVVDETGKLLTGAAALDYYRKSLGDSGGAAKKMGDALNNDLGGAIKALQNAISNAGTLFGEHFEKPFTNAIRVVNLAVRGLTQLFAQGGFSGEVLTEMDKAGNGGIKNFAITVFLWGKRIENFFTELGASFGEAFKKYKPVIDTLGDAFTALGMALGIIGQTSDQNASKFDSFGSAGAGVGAVLADIAGTLAGVLADAIILVIGYVELMKEEWELVGPAVMDALQIVKGAFGILGGVVSGDWNTLWDGLVDVVFGAMKSAVSIFSAALKIITMAMDALTFNHFNYTAKVETETQQSLASLDRTGEALKDPGKTTTTKSLAAVALDREAGFRRYDSGQSDERPSFLDKPQHIHTHVHLDGTQLAEALTTVKRDLASRSYHSVDDHGGDH